MRCPVDTTIHCIARFWCWKGFLKAVKLIFLSWKNRWIVTFLLGCEGLRKKRNIRNQMTGQLWHWLFEAHKFIWVCRAKNIFLDSNTKSTRVMASFRSGKLRANYPLKFGKLMDDLLPTGKFCYENGKLANWGWFSLENWEAHWLIQWLMLDSRRCLHRFLPGCGLQMTVGWGWAMRIKQYKSMVLLNFWPWWYDDPC